MKKLEMEAILFKNKLDPIANISDWVTYENLKWDDISTLELEIPDRIKGIEYKVYNEIKKKRYIVIDNKSRYIIEEVIEKKDKNKSIKSIIAYSLEKIFEKRNISFESIPYSLEDICRIIEEASGWSVSIIDDIENSSINYNIEGSYKLLTFLRDTLEDLYSIHCEFDTMNNKINIYSKNNKKYSLYADYDNLIEEVEVKNEEDIVTRLINDTDISIAEQHITNEEYIEDYSYLIENDNITESLKESLKKYDLFLKSMSENYNVLRNKMNTLEAEQSNIEKQISDTEELIKEKKEEKNNLESDSQKYKDLEAEIENLEDVTLVNLNKDLENKKASIEAEDVKFKELGERCSKKNSNCFSKSDLEELNELLIEESFNDSSLSSQDLLIKMKDKLKYLNAPKVEYTLNINGIKRIIDNLKEGSLKIGNLFYFPKQIEIDELRLVGFRYNFQDNTIDNIEFSNSKDISESKYDFFGNVVSETNKAKRKVEKVEVKVERIEEGLETKVSKGDFSSYRIQTYKMIQEKISAGDVESIVTQNADSWSLSINGKLIGKTYKFDGEGFKLGSSDSGNTAIHTNEYSMWKHSNGDYSRADATGFYRNGTGVYHSLIEVGTGMSGGSAGVLPKTVTVQLPNKFKGKNFKVIVSMVDTRGGEHLEYVKRIYLNIDSIDTTNATFNVTGYWTSILDTIENEKELQWSYVAIGG